MISTYVQNSILLNRLQKTYEKKNKSFLISTYKAILIALSGLLFMFLCDLFNFTPEGFWFKSLYGFGFGQGAVISFNNVATLNDFSWAFATVFAFSILLIRYLILIGSLSEPIIRLRNKIHKVKDDLIIPLAVQDQMFMEIEQITKNGELPTDEKEVKIILKFTNEYSKNKETQKKQKEENDFKVKEFKKEINEKISEIKKS